MVSDGTSKQSDEIQSVMNEETVWRNVPHSLHKNWTMNDAHNTVKWCKQSPAISVINNFRQSQWVDSTCSMMQKSNM